MGNRAPIWESNFICTCITFHHIWALTADYQIIKSETNELAKIVTPILVTSTFSIVSVVITKYLKAWYFIKETFEIASHFWRQKFKVEPFPLLHLCWGTSRCMRKRPNWGPAWIYNNTHTKTISLKRLELIPSEDSSRPHLLKFLKSEICQFCIQERSRAFHSAVFMGCECTELKCLPVGGHVCTPCSNKQDFEGWSLHFCFRKQGIDFISNNKQTRWATRKRRFLLLLG